MSDWWESLIWASPEWRTPAAALALLAGAAILLSYALVQGPRHVRWLGASLKALAIAALVFCLLEPMRTEERPQPGANLFVVLTDNSRSVTLKDKSEQSVREQIRSALDEEQWQARLGQDFDVRRYVFGERLRSVGDWEGLSFDAAQSSLAAALKGIHQRFAGQPLAGILLMSDGNATDNVEQWLQQAKAAGTALAPIFPVRFEAGKPAADASVQRVTVRQTNFEDSPVLITADVAAEGFPDAAAFSIELRNSKNEVIDQVAAQISANDSVTVELRAKPEAAGLHFYKLILKPSGAVEKIAESTTENNQRLVMVERSRGPYRVLYVAGRPNWEFKFLRRATEEDNEIDLVALLRIARKEPKFIFKDRDTGSSNPLFQGFEDKDQDDVEQYDQPVIMRLGVEDANELRDGFPKDAEALFGFQAIILDDLESRFFDEDQLSLIKEFVSQRGGGLMMLGGAGSFQSGGYEETLLGDMLPVYLNDQRGLPPDPSTRYRMQLSREGWLQPWMRMRSSEVDERQRLQEMPMFQMVNGIRRIKPGATVLASVEVLRRSQSTGDDLPSTLPALISQRYGKGQVAALMIADYWKWATMRPKDAPRDLEKAWRQTLRWLISDVPRRVEAVATVDPVDGDVSIVVDVRDESFQPLDNAELEILVATPDDRIVSISATQSKQPGVYEAKFVSRDAGPYLVQVSAADPDGSEIGEAETGWTHEPTAQEFQSLQPNRELMEQLAEQTGGARPVSLRLEPEMAKIAQRKSVVNETRLTPVWHRWYVFMFAALCLAGEWGLRRWHGLP